MSDSATSDQLRIEDVLEFNEQLRSIESMRVPIGLGFEFGKESLSNQLMKISSSLTIQQVRGKSIELALAEDRSIPNQYRVSLISWARSGRSFHAVQPLVEIGRWRRDAVSQVNSTLLEPLILLVLVYCGFVCLMWSLIPNLESVYSQIHKPPGVSLSIMSSIRASAMWWGPVVPILIVGILAVWKRTVAHANLSWIPESFLETQAVRKANQADSLACLIESGLGSASATELTNGTANAPSPTTLSPLARWASGIEDRPSIQVDALRCVTRIYRDTLQYQLIRWSRWYSIAIGTLIGGSLVLALGVCLFAPIIELLYTLVLP